jgi:hypothetical protein
MNAKDIALAAFVILTVVFASMSLSEYSELNCTASTTVTTTVTITCPINRICGSFTYNTSGGPVQVNSVEANNGSVNGQ